LAQVQKKVKVARELAGLRLDVGLSRLFPDLSRRKVRKIIDVGGAYVNRKRVRVASRVLCTNDILEVVYDERNLATQKEQAYELSDNEILFRGSDLIAINKPPGLASQATRAQSIAHAERSLQMYMKKCFEDPTGLTLLHRLDRDTSGVLLFGLSERRSKEIFEAFRHREMSKTYWAITRGIPKEENFTIQCLLSDIDPKVGIVRKVADGGKPSHTDFKVLAVNKDLDLAFVECNPITGRSHQIRIHLEIAGTPIVGDRRYGGAPKKPMSEELTTLASRHHFLHARRLQFELSNRKFDIVAEPTVEFTGFVAAANLQPN
jgi:RluA family pseudouridine synthase